MSNIVKLFVLTTLILWKPYARAQELGDSLYAFTHIQQSNTICKGESFKTMAGVTGVVLLALSVNILTEGRYLGLPTTLREFKVLAHLATDGRITLPPPKPYKDKKELAMRLFRKLRKAGWAGVGLSAVLLGSSLAIDSGRFGDWINAMKDEFSFTSFFDSASAMTLLESFENEPGAFYSIFLQLSPEQAEPFLEISPILRVKTLEFARAVEPIVEALEKPNGCNKLEVEVKRLEADLAQ